MFASTRRMCGWRLISSTCFAALMFAGTASADVGTNAPNALSPVPVPKPKPGAGGTQPQAPAPLISEFTCNNTWDPIANEPNKYIIGECGGPGQGSPWHLRRQEQFGPTTLSDGSTTYFDGGYIFGDFNHCGWINYDQDTLAPGSPTPLCSPNPSTNLRDFAEVANCAPGACGDGTPTYNSSSCLEVANVSPWNTTLTPTGYIRTAPAGDTYTSPSGVTTSNLRWRYVVGNGGAYRADAYGNYWVEVRDQKYTQGNGNWVFVPLSCLANPLAPGPGGYYVP